MFREKFEYDTLLEEVVLGACLIEQTAFARTKGLIDPEMFYHDIHREIYRGLSDMFEDGYPIDTVIYAQISIKNGTVGKYPTLVSKVSEMASKVASAANLETHCLFIRELFIKRLLFEIKNSTGDGDVLDEMDALQEKLKKAREIKSTNDWQEFKTILIDLKLKMDSHIEDGVKTGISEIDDIRGGLKPSEMIIIGARPSVGKTAFAAQLALNMATIGTKVGIISLEMSNVQLAMRILSIVSDLDFWKLDKSAINNEIETEKLNQGFEKSFHLPIFMSEKTGVTISDIRAKAMKLIYKNSLDILFIDYLGLVEPEQNKNRNREQEVSAMSRGLKLLAMELNIPVVVLAQLNRETEHGKGQKPKLSNLRDSGSIEQDADMVIFLHSDYKSGIETNDKGESTENERDIIIAKYRNGETKSFKIGFEAKKMKFGNSYAQETVKKDEFVIF